MDFLGKIREIASVHTGPHGGEVVETQEACQEIRQKATEILSMSDAVFETFELEENGKSVAHCIASIRKAVDQVEDVRDDHSWARACRNIIATSLRLTELLRPPLSMVSGSDPRPAVVKASVVDDFTNRI